MTGPGDGPGITVRLLGGLGNQLFQYAAGRAVAERLRCPLYVDAGRLAAVLPGDTPRSFDLGWLVDPAHVRAATTPRLPARLLRRVANRVHLPTGTFAEASFAYDSRIESVQVGATLEGYFQSWRYFAEISDSLRGSIRDAAPRSPWFEESAAALAAGGPWIAVHVRRGDYVRPRNAAFHGLLGRRYYQSALGALRERGTEGRLVVFSDEPDAAVELLGADGADAVAVRPPASAHPMESIALMSLAGGIITANSSFSWWGAWLADPGRSEVACPTPWLARAGADERDLRPREWVSVDAGFGLD
ncbi:MAG: alpha-1,2-fucosyltransferase [Candidatus Nanopelagicales bacterium]